MALTLPPCPASIKPIQHYLKTATEHEKRDPVITYWCRLAALQNGMGMDKSSKESLAVLLPLMDWLENTKKDMSDNEAITNEAVASAHIENHAMKLFLWADKEDREARFNKNVVKAFYTSGMLFDVLSTLGELTPEISHHKKYAKWKAAYIHSCLKNGEVPVPGPMATGDEEDLQFPTVPGADETPSNIPGSAAEGSPGGAAGFPANPPEPSVPQIPDPIPQNISGGGSNPVHGLTNLNIQSTGGAKLSLEQITKAQKFCKYAISSLDYEDIETAILNLNKALHLCRTGQEM